MVAREIKKVLAYSTVSQIGYMFLALGAGGLIAHGIAEGLMAGMFHLMSHALFKAALFLAAGAVIHAVESRFMYHMGGLKKHMPITYVTMLLAALSLAGVPPLSGFWSKEAVLTVAWEAIWESGPAFVGPFVISVVTAALTAFYTLRMVGLTFHGERSHRVVELEAEGHEIEEASPIMYVPYALLATASLCIGLVGWALEEWIKEAFEEASLGILPPKALHLTAHHLGAALASPQLLILSISLLALVVGALPAYLIYIARRIDPSIIIARSPALSAVRTFFFKRWYINKLYYKAFVYPTITVAQGLYRWAELRGYEKAIVGGLVSGVVSFASKFRRLQTGFLNYNVIGMLIGLLLVALILLGLGGLL